MSTQESKPKCHVIYIYLVSLPEKPCLSYVDNQQSWGHWEATQDCQVIHIPFSSADITYLKTFFPVLQTQMYFTQCFQFTALLDVHWLMHGIQQQQTLFLWWIQKIATSRNMVVKLQDNLPPLTTIEVLRMLETHREEF